MPMAKPKQIAVLLVFVLLLFSCQAPAATGLHADASQKELRIGVLLSLDQDTICRRFQELREHLHTFRPDSRATIIPMSTAELNSAVEEQRIDLIITNPAHYIALRHNFGLSEPLVTMVHSHYGTPIKGFGVTLFARSDNPASNSITDLPHRTLALPVKGSFGLAILQYELQARKLPRILDKNLIITGLPHEQVVQAVLTGRADFGFVRSGSLELLAAQKRLDPAQIKIINKKPYPEFPFAVSSRLFSDWPVAALRHLSQEDKKWLTAALLLFKRRLHFNPIFSLEEFSTPANYDAAETMMRTMRMPPFNHIPELRPAEVLMLYRGEALFVFSCLMIALVLGIYLFSSRQQLKRERQRYANILLGTDVGTWEWHIPSGRARFNKQWTAMLGYELSELEPTTIETWDLLTHPDDLNVAEKRIQQHFEGKSRLYECELRMRHKDGHWVWILDRGQVLRRDSHENPLLMCGTHMDITRRKHAEEQQKRLSEIVERSVNEIYLIDPDTFMFVQANRAAQENLGYSMEELRGMTLVDIKPEFTPHTLTEMVRPLKTKQQDLLTFVTQLQRKNGQTYTAEIHAQIIELPSETVIAAIALDISARKAAEQHLKATLVELKRSNQDLEQFAYIASHDLQEPLRMVSSYTQLLERRYHDKLDDDAREFMYFAVDGAKRMQRMIDDLLAYSRVTTQGKSLIRQSMLNILNDAQLNLRQAIEESQAKILCAELPEVMGDRAQLLQLLQNLLSNSIKFRRAEEPPVIHVNAEVAPDNPAMIRFSIADNGIGFDPKFTEQVFTLFRRLHERPKYPGTGIGLAVCKRIVQRHNGKIWCHTVPGCGTTFFFTLPRVQETGTNLDAPVDTPR